MRRHRIAALLVVMLAPLALAPSAHARIGSCAGCATVTDVDEIYYARDRAPAGATTGTIIGGTITGRKPANASAAATGGLIGREARGKERGGDERGLRLELKMDGGGRRTIEVGEGLRIYKGDRLRVFGDRIETLD